MNGEKNDFPFIRELLALLINCTSHFAVKQNKKNWKKENNGMVWQ